MTIQEVIDALNEAPDKTQRFDIEIKRHIEGFDGVYTYPGDDKIVLWGRLGLMKIEV